MEMGTHGEEQAAEPGFQRTETQSSLEKKDNLNHCPACTDSRRFDLSVIDFNRVSPHLCDRCKFVHDVVEAGIARGVFRVTGTRQEITAGWTDESYYQSQRSTRKAAKRDKQNAWSDLHWRNYSNRNPGSPISRFELFVLPGCQKPFPCVPEKSLPSDTSSTATLAKVQAWIRKCQQTHKFCSLQQSQPNTLPRRVIDVTADPVRVLETDEGEGHYACLSHCWGGVEPSCRTTSGTLAANQRGIAWDTMPKTFQDAVDFTRRLGLKYIWIDSICIIQDDLMDWAEQSAKMANIYENAFITLCATASSNDNGGCYSIPPPLWRPHGFRITKDTTEYEVFIRCCLDERHIPAWHTASRGSFMYNLPLMTRAWTFQERLLSKRLIHFVAGEVMWECSEMSDCECFSAECEKQSPYMQYHSSKANHRNTLHSEEDEVLENYWNSIVFAYSGLKLTFEKDKLPALSGVAQQMSSRRPGDTYIAGLWKNSILADLRWSRWEDNTRRPGMYRAPSWSWASLDGIVQGEYYSISTPIAERNYANCIDVSVTLAGPDPTGEVSAGYIILEAPLKSAILHTKDDSPGWWDKWHISADGFTTKFSPDCFTDFEDGSLAIGDEVVCLRLGKSLYNYDMCLVLKERGLENGEPLYHRVGIMRHRTDEIEQHWFGPDAQIGQVKIL
ncbi:HET-domain-containing protein [Pyrenochaeta sp. DS3sAY3a]|nr:HET-domain-containing protein [Pyrenochaeta sp. DS3sAY3a]